MLPVHAAALMHAVITHVKQLDVAIFKNKKEPDQDEKEFVCRYLDFSLIVKN